MERPVSGFASRWGGRHYGWVMVVVGGMLTVLFFTVWRHAFGTQHLGKVQDAAQMVTVLASAVGPVLVTLSEAHTGSYTLVFLIASSASALAAVLALMTPVPDARSGHWEHETRVNP